jgi:hypothetical protein
LIDAYPVKESINQCLDIFLVNNLMNSKRILKKHRMLAHEALLIDEVLDRLQSLN